MDSPVTATVTSASAVSEPRTTVPSPPCPVTRASRHSVSPYQKHYPVTQLRFVTRTLVPSHLRITAPSSLAIMTPLHRALLESLSDPLVASFRAAHQCTCGLPRDPSIPACTAEPASVSIKEHFSTESLHVNNPELLAHVVHPKIPQDLDKFACCLNCASASPLDT